ncbi:MAG: hypothetical protein ACXIUV_03985 [Alkalilacustris sp.]
MPNAFAFLALFSWPIVVVALFRLLPLPQALCWSLIGGYLLLPERAGFNFPMLPSLDKHSVPSLAAAIMCVGLAYRDRLEEARRRGQALGMGPGALLARLRSVPRPGGARAVFYGLLALIFLGPILTVLTNREPRIVGQTVLPGLSLYDAGSVIQGAIIAMIPFMLAMRFLATSARHVILLRVLVISALGYSLLMLVEMRMSPQISTWVYGFFPHRFDQHIRAFGWRPVVFLHHGLWLGIYIAGATLAACVLWRQARQDRTASARWAYAALWLAPILVLSGALGATLIALLIAAVVLLASPRLQIVFAAVLAGSVLLFPMLRGAGLVPTEAILSAAAWVDERRVGSLNFRFVNEDRLLAHAAQKPLAGWGGWGRNRVFDEATGEDITTTDGAWIIIIGSHGWVGYVARFGLLTLPIILLALRRRDRLTPATTGLALVAAAGLTDLIPNATLTPVTWLVGGALAGRFLREERWITDPGGAAGGPPGTRAHGTTGPAQGPSWLAGRPMPVAPALAGYGATGAGMAGSAMAPPRRSRLAGAVLPLDRDHGRAAPASAPRGPELPRSGAGKRGPAGPARHGTAASGRVLHGPPGSGPVPADPTPPGGPQTRADPDPGGPAAAGPAQAEAGTVPARLHMRRSRATVDGSVATTSAAGATRPAGPRPAGSGTADPPATPPLHHAGKAPAADPARADRTPSSPRAHRRAPRTPQGSGG